MRSALADRVVTLAVCVAAGFASARVRAQAVESQCVPACRSSYVCVQNQCVSACNPPCPNGTQCTERLTCEGAPPEAAEVSRYVLELEAWRKQATEYRHDGFYLRFGATFGYVFVDADMDDEQDVESVGLGGSLDFAMGGSLSDGFVMAFALHMVAVPSPATSVDGDEIRAAHSSFYQVTGLRLDFYPDPSRGLHGAVTFGFGSADIQLDSEAFDNETSAAGVGLVFTAGYDFWIAKQWSIGLSAQVMYIHSSEDNFGKHNVLVPMAVLSALYH